MLPILMVQAPTNIVYGFGDEMSVLVHKN